MGTSCNITSANRHYAVTAIDRYGNEGPACQDVNAPTAPAPTTSAITVQTLPCDGQTLTVPNGFEDAEYLIVETMQGTIIATHQNKRQIDVSGIPQGYYRLKTLTAQGITRHIGYFVR